MSNKSQLQTNNTDLQSILSTVMGLPTQESCKTGQYVWERYEYTPERTVTNPTFKFATISSSVSTIKITSDSVDLTKVTSEFFAGFTFTDTTGTSCNFKLNTGTSDGELIMFMGLSVTLNYDPKSTSFVQAGSMGIGTACSGRTATYNGNKTLPASQGAFLDYVVSDSETAYPDGGTQDGYWYEKVVGVDILYKGFAELKGYSKIAKDKFIYSKDLNISASSSNPTKFSHSLGETPKAVMVIADRFKKTTAQTSSDYHQLLIACLQQYGTNNYSTCSGVVWGCNDSYLNYSVSNVGGIIINSLSNSQVQVYFVTTSDGNNYPVLCAGVEYTLITMA